MQLSQEFRGQLVRVKSEPPDVACLPEQGQVHQQHCGAAADMHHIKEKPRAESSEEHPVAEVKTEPYSAAISTERDHMGHRCDSTSKGMAAGMCHIKEEQREESSNEDPVIEVKTEPYNISISAGQDQVGHNCDSALEGARASTGLLHVKDQPRGICDQDSSGRTSSEAQFKISTMTVEPQFDSALLVTTNGEPTERLSDQSKPCAPEYTSKDSLKQHVFAQCHSESEMCAITSPPDDQMGDESLTYDICSPAFSPSGSDESHVSKRTNEKSCKSDLSPGQSHQRRSLQCHKRAQTGDEPDKSDVCPAKLSQVTHRLLHKRTQTSEKPYRCNVCPAEFSRRGKLQQHKRTHTGEKPYKCDFCPAEFTQSTNLRQHKRIHTGEKPYKCDVCPAMFRQSGNLRQHKRTHTGEKPYKCCVCHAKFGQIGTLRHHERTHTGEKPYECDVCPAEFNTSGNLRKHKRTHTGEKPYKCNACPAEFSQNRTLQNHKRTHTGEKPYKCDVCSAEFSRSKGLMSHKRKHTGEKHHK
ncbi:zinc finger protein 391-like isoform X1 [Ornithodoros turicata]|uniref:zinc finger protein 391-like isoform X1 n=1 Tax=Ornithodoros turicata TaxID=34597 RepID=UPI003139CE65